MGLFEIVMLVLLAYGFWVGWKDISYGRGIAGRMSDKSLNWLNKKDWKSIIVKIIITLFLSYAYLAYKLIMALLYLLNVIFHL